MEINVNYSPAKVRTLKAGDYLFPSNKITGKCSSRLTKAIHNSRSSYPTLFQLKKKKGKKAFIEFKMFQLLFSQWHFQLLISQ